MPELPEVETVMRGMRARLDGHTIAGVIVRRPDLRWPLPPDLALRLDGARIEGFRRRGKYIFMRLSGGFSLLLHLGMSGRVKLSEHGELIEPERHEHITFITAEGARFGLVDPRRFGAVDLIATEIEDTHKLVATMGPEPLEAGFSAAILEQGFAGRRSPVKALLLDQRLVAGLGNIYVCEALFRAGIYPAEPASALDKAAIGRLTRAIREVLKQAIAAGGSSLRDYVQPDGELGYFQHAWRVYGRAGQPCPDCPGEPGCAGVQQIVQSGRSSFFCPRKQRLGGAVPAAGRRSRR